MRKYFRSFSFKTSIFALFLLIFISAPALATTDGGNLASFVGFFGSKQHLALVMVGDFYFSEDPCSDCTARLFAIDLNEVPAKRWGKEVVVYQGDVSRNVKGRIVIEPQQIWKKFAAQQKEAKQFVAAKRLKPFQLQETGITDQTRTYLDSKGQPLQLSIQTQKEFIASKNFSSNDDLEYEQACKPCSKEPMVSYGKTSRVPVCPASAKSQKNKQGQIIDCRARGYIFVPQLKYRNQTEQGLQFVAYPGVVSIIKYYDLPYKSPDSEITLSLKDVSEDFEVYQNKEGQVIAVGSVVHDMSLNSTSLPVIATHSGK